MDITVILNAASGHDDKQRARQQIEAVLATSGHKFTLVEAPAKGLTSAVRQAVAAARADPAGHAIVAAGGDGTINAVATELTGTGIRMGVIPLGTFNFFARNLGIPLDAARAAQVVLEGNVRRIPLARVNGRAFLINSSFGLYRRLQEERERYKRRFGRNKIVAAIAALFTLLRHHRSYRVGLDVDGKPLMLHTPMVFFAFNTLQLEKLGLPDASCTANGYLAVLALPPVSRWELLGLALRGALHTLGDSPNMRSYCASQLEVQLPGARRLKVAVDGETTECTLPLRYEVLPDALSVLVPKNPEPRQ